MLVWHRAGLLAGFGVRRLLAGRSAGSSPRLALAAIVAAIAIDLRPILRLEPVWPEPPPIYGALAGTRASCLPSSRSAAATRNYSWHIPFMYFSLWHWVDMVNGYSGHSPDGTGDFEQELVGRFPRGTNARRSCARAGRRT